MKPFKEYLAESKKVYNFKVKVAGELPESFQDLDRDLDRDRGQDRGQDRHLA